MNTAYAKAAGKYAPTLPDIDNLNREELLQQQHAEWLRHPQTAELLAFLSCREDDLKNNATLGADAGRNEELLLRLLHKAAAIKEVINYVQRNKRPNDNANG